MGTEKIAVSAWTKYINGEPMPELGIDLVTKWSIGKKQRGSQNHGPMVSSAGLLERSLRLSLPNDIDRAIDHAINLYDIQIEQGHRCRELGGYTHYHQGAAAAHAIAARRLLYYHAHHKAIDLINRVYQWWSNEVAILKELRAPDGQVLTVGVRCQPHDYPVWKGAVPTIACQILNPLPMVQLAPWIEALVPPGITDLNLPKITHQDSVFGWYKPGTATDSLCLRLLLRAIRFNAIRLHEAKPKVAAKIYTWIDRGSKHAAATILTGLAPRQWHSVWKDGRCRTITSEMKGGGSGTHQSPNEVDQAIPTGLGLVPVFNSTLVVKSKPTPKPPKPVETVPTSVPETSPKQEVIKRYRKQLHQAINDWHVESKPTTDDLLGLLNEIKQKGL